MSITRGTIIYVPGPPYGMNIGEPRRVFEVVPAETPQPKPGQVPVEPNPRIVPEPALPAGT